MKNLWVSVCFVALLTSCVSSHEILSSYPREPNTSVTSNWKTSYDNVQNVEEKDLLPYFLWDVLYDNINFRSYRGTYTTADEVILELKRGRKLIAKLVRNGEVIDELILKGRMRSSHFSIRRRLMIYPIFFVKVEEKVLLIKEDNGDLIIKGGTENIVFSLISGHSEYYFKNKFNKLYDIPLLNPSETTSR